MNKILLITIILLVTINNFAQIERLQNETAEDFAHRNAPPKSEIVHQVIETNVWGRKKTVIAFYQFEINLDKGLIATQVDGYLYLPISQNLYRKILIHSFEEEGGTAEIEAVFFANADKDKPKELIIISSWTISHYDASGKLYSTFIFDDLGNGADSMKIKYLENVSKKVSGGCDCNFRDGRKGTKKFNSVAKVKVGLKKLGFK